jgi:hypothetical protein
VAALNFGEASDWPVENSILTRVLVRVLHFWSATIHRRFGIFRLGANYSLSNVSCGDAEKVLRTEEQSGDKSPQSQKKCKTRT